jgi:hypothetical protein
MVVPQTSHLFFLEKADVSERAIVDFCRRAVSGPNILQAPSRVVG